VLQEVLVEEAAAVEPFVKNDLFHQELLPFQEE